jgi:hypothetical protein
VRWCQFAGSEDRDDLVLQNKRRKRECLAQRRLYTHQRVRYQAEGRIFRCGVVAEAWRELVGHTSALLVPI